MITQSLDIPNQIQNIINQFSTVPDPRCARGQLHNFIDIVVIALIAMICGADDAEGIEDYGQANEAWFKSFLELPNGIPSQDTYLRIFALIDPKEFERAFERWIQSLKFVAPDKHYAIDGKTNRGSFDRAAGLKPIHMVSAWLTTTGLALGQVKTDVKTNEITAIPELLRLLDLRDATVTIDAMGCQTSIAKHIIEGGGHYILAVKENQPTLYQQIEHVFTSSSSIEIETFTQHNKGHGRIEVRRVQFSKDLSPIDVSERWVGLQGIVKVESQRTEILSGKTTIENRYYIVSNPNTNAEQLNTLIRNHWSIENSLHWVLDVTFNEDASRIRTKNAAQNISLIRKVAINILKHSFDSKRSIRRKRHRCGWDHDYMLSTIDGIILS